jgi:hypothetical protein
MPIDFENNTTEGTSPLAGLGRVQAKACGYSMWLVACSLKLVICDLCSTQSRILSPRAPHSRFPTSNGESMPRQRARGECLF